MSSTKELLAERIKNFPGQIKNGAVAIASNTSGLAVKLVGDLKQEFLDIVEDVKTELRPNKDHSITFLKEVGVIALSFVHIPYLPAFHSPGWMLRYILGPYDKFWIDGIISDIGAGLTVGLTLIPQALSYAQLANLPPINGLYSAVLPSAVYTFFGTGLQLAVGPVALVSLLTGTLVTQYNVSPGTQDAVNVATQAALSVGIILTTLGLLNLGSLIHYVAFPVMSGFTTGAAMIIGLTQLKNAFGFTNSPPQTGQPGYTYNYQVMQWFSCHWYDINYITITEGVKVTYQPSTFNSQNPVGYAPSQVQALPVQNAISLQFTFGLFIPLILLKLLQTRLHISLSKEFQDTYVWKAIDFVINISPFIGLIISAHEAWLFMRDVTLDPDPNSAQYNKAIIIPSTYSPTKSPTKHPTTAPAGTTPPTVSPTIGPAASYSPTWPTFSPTRAPTKQPMFAASTYAGNYYQTKFGIVGYVTPGLGFIAEPVLPYEFWTFLASTIPLAFVAFMEGYGVANRIATLRNELHILNASQELWAIGVSNLLGSISSALPVSGSFSRSSLNHSCGARTPLSKATTLLLVVTALGTLTGTFFYIPNAALSAIIWVAIWPLIKLDHIWYTWKYSKKDFFLIIVTFTLEFLFNTEIGLAVGLSVSLAVYVFATVFSKEVQLNLIAKAVDNNGIDVISVETASITFINVISLKTSVLALTFTDWKTPREAIDNFPNRIHNTVSHALDTVLRPDLLKPVKFLPKAVVVDWTHVRAVDITAFIGLQETIDENVKREINIIFFNIHESILPAVRKFNIKNVIFDEDDPDVNYYVKLSGLDTITKVHASKDVLLPEVYHGVVHARSNGGKDVESLE